jgi:hypothetical protein
MLDSLTKVMVLTLLRGILSGTSVSAWTGIFQPSLFQGWGRERIAEKFMLSSPAKPSPRMQSLLVAFVFVNRTPTQVANPMCGFQEVNNSAKASEEAKPACWQQKMAKVWLKIIRNQREERCHRSRAQTRLAW